MERASIVRARSLSQFTINLPHWLTLSILPTLLIRLCLVIQVSNSPHGTRKPLPVFMWSTDQRKQNRYRANR